MPVTTPGALPKDSNGEYFFGPFTATGGEGRAPRGDNDDGTYADFRIVTVPLRGSLTDRSGTLAAAATAQQIAAANLSRSYLLILNLDTVNPLWINFGVNAVQDQPSIRIDAGVQFELPAGFISTQSISVIGPVLGQKFTAKEG